MLRFLPIDYWNRQHDSPSVQGHHKWTKSKKYIGQKLVWQGIDQQVYIKFKTIIVGDQKDGLRFNN